MWSWADLLSPASPVLIARTTGLIRQALKTSSDTSPGADGITHSMICHAEPAGYTTNVTPTSKSKDPGRYRPIPFLPCLTQQDLSKVGPLHFCITPTLRRWAHWNASPTSSPPPAVEKTIAVFLDLEKAFKLAGETVFLALLTDGAKSQLLRWKAKWAREVCA